MVNTPRYLWGEALLASVYLYNRTPYSSLGYKTPIKELRFAISLPFSAAGDAENGRLSATSFCHAPALSADAPSSVMLPA
jgi:hypothetical protein